ncbi:hypothetical protein [Escherichia coli]|uniref:hypothetical protein n=1 Tax=Escherichia coli TaxID=562 RepID=UPI000B7F1BF8|nr:hypothetical protein [Escherichia coli]MBB2277632.1 hypothetical protein [Escherichia coli]HAV9150726.1 hypothetical protein [Escherichia coli]HAW1203821.1 hypothetical protein [Escherichia coli]HAW1217626.1 hypothetical protein [Escherichia coli]HAW2239656.1 hypothetical protein [Escherichia coli]
MPIQSQHKNIDYLSARLEATALVLEELVKLLTPEQREKLNLAIAGRCPGVKNASLRNRNSPAYQLLQFINDRVGCSD